MTALLHRLRNLETNAGPLLRLILDRPLDVDPDETPAESWARQYPGEPIGIGPPMTEAARQATWGRQ